MFNLDFFRRSSLRGTTLLAAPSKSYALSTNYHACIALPTSRRCALPILFWPWPPYDLLPRSFLTWIFFVDPHWWVPLCVQCPAKAMHFKQIIMHALQCQHDVDVHLLFCFDIDLRLICSQVHVFMLPRSCLTWIFFVDSHWWVPLCVQHPTIYMPFRQLIMYILQCPHDIHVHLCCFDLHKFLLRSRTATCPTLNCGCGHPCSDRSLLGWEGGQISHIYDIFLHSESLLAHSFTDFYLWHWAVCGHWMEQYGLSSAAGGLKTCISVTEICVMFKFYPNKSMGVLVVPQQNAF